LDQEPCNRAANCCLIDRMKKSAPRKSNAVAGISKVNIINTGQAKNATAQKVYPEKSINIQKLILSQSGKHYQGSYRRRRRRGIQARGHLQAIESQGCQGAYPDVVAVVVVDAVVGEGRAPVRALVVVDSILG
jgi:hypothetical protein